MSLYEFGCRVFQTAAKLSAPLLDWREPQLIAGPGSVMELPRLLKRLGLARVLLVTDQGLMKTGLPLPLLKGLGDLGIFCAVYDKTQANPTVDNVEAARKLYAETKCEAIIAIGGGSPMDCAKGAGALAARPGKTIPQMRGVLKVCRKLPPLFAVPTTAGTGSEATVAAVVTEPDTHEKYAVMDPCLCPQYAVLDPQLTLGLPPHLTAATGMDALTHAVEAYIGRSNTKKTARLALEATGMIFAWLETAYRDGANLEARENMLRASYKAGVAFTRAYVGYVHAIAHTLGGLYGVPHGFANAVLLPHVLDWYGAAARPRLAELARAAHISGENDAALAHGFIARVREMNARMEIPETLDSVQEEDIPLIATRALREANPLYPVPKIMGQAACEALLRNILA